ncbi:MAG: rhomboid family intramembrane serine protease [Propionibacteriaceae bacterium]|nr:rhomboid family intramembrane serine protease [Propionibacteriaceae bacterium]
MQAEVCYRHPERAARIVCQRCERPICPDCMVQGSVGFHCPECVKANPQPKVQLKTRLVQPNQVTSLVIIGINLAVWVAILATGMGASPLINRLALLPHGVCPYDPGRILLTDPAGCAAAGATWLPGVATGAFWQVLTSAFTHIQPWHIFFNMMALWVLGPQVEMAFGRARFVAMYLFSALTAGVLVMIFGTPFGGTLGASGAIFGLMGAFLVVALKQRHSQSIRSVLIWLGLNAVITFMVPNVSWEGHLGGLLGGVAITALMVYLPRKHRRWEWTLIGLLGALAVAAIVVISLLRFS